MMPARRSTILLRALAPVATTLLVSCGPATRDDRIGPATRDDRIGAALAGEQVVPLATVTFSGHRYVARASFGAGDTIPLMVHGNARVYLMLTHGGAERLTGKPVPKREDYGYSAKGKGAIEVSAFSLGGKRFEHVSDVPVFDFTDDGDTTVQGMVGTRFLTEARAAVDFSRNVLVLGVPISPVPNARLVASGYAHVPMKVSPQFRVTIDARFPAIGRTIAITPSTVSTALTLHRPLFDGRVPMRRAPSPDRSPNRTSPDEFFADRVAFEVAGVPFRSDASLEDLAEYADVPEVELESYGMLGYDWMAEHQAVLDYANRILYFKR